MRTRFLIAAGSLLLAAILPALSDTTWAADDDRPADPVMVDLAKLQGKWEVTLRSGGKPIRNVQTIHDTTSIVDRYDENGILVHSHTADFKLSVSGQARIFTFFNLRVTAGPQAGKGFKGPLSFVYVLDGDVWTEARGLLADQRDGNPRLTFWHRMVNDKAARKRPPPRK